ncbi:uncharacterized protein LACBIDRAFT_301868 [Laccaria bicolor S238N-H82]|uniref:Predicted protein n=1 Tax=Laccaria bicolor (strain S238N-H82 / ATCC MYA-4686) TaxID=486041 RepID=B0CPL0_LACBS|nr:uncharacterized protein LACBIDRAFT_301868 [Laccaria bicolor S238N-H82]EDR15475.1 predicted protein [Laccaria bicolor S238N-H82]|eukprot:XP_001873683.1 predicted protein [Laccaria bicolor S238N-H82]
MPCFADFEILSPLLDVCEEKFLDSSDLAKSPFSLSPLSSSVVLEVCKSWLRVSTPLLYRVVILRSNAQAKALERTLKSNKSFGLFIKKLRVEGGYGAAMKTILQASPNIAHLWITLALRSEANVSGLCFSLWSINPSRVTLHDSWYEARNAQVLKLAETLLNCLEKWTKLTTVDLPYLSEHHVTLRADSLAQSLVVSKSLKTVNALTRTYYSIPSWLRILGDSTSLESIHLRPTTFASFLSQLQQLPRLQSLVVFDEVSPDLRSSVEIEPSDDSSLGPTLIPSNFTSNPMRITPLSHVSQDLRDRIWDLVIQFAIGINDLEDERLPTSGDVITWNKTRLALCHVSKYFKTLVEPYLYAYPMFTDMDSRLRGFAARLKEDPSLRTRLRALYMAGGAIYPLRIQGDIQDTLQQIFEDGTVAHENKMGVVRVCGLGEARFCARIRWDVFESMASASGSTVVSLRNLRIESPTKKRQNPSVFFKFSALRILAGAVLVEFSDSPKNINRDSLSNLERVELTAVSPSCLKVLSLMKLPMFHTLSLPSSKGKALLFLASHGSKLRVLDIELEHELRAENLSVFDLCPNLVSLTMRVFNNTQGLLNPASQFTQSKLTKIVLLRNPAIGGKRFNHKIHASFFEAIDAKNFPVLQEIQVDFCEWPILEHEIKKSVWPRWAEYLATHNIRLTDKDGRHWRPRLQSSRRR